MCYQPEPEETQRVVPPIPDGHKCDGTFGVTHIATDDVWQLMELLQCYVAAWRLPTDESSEQGLDRQDAEVRTAAQGAETMTTAAVEAVPADRAPEHDPVSAFWALSQAPRAEGKHPEVIAKDAVAHLEATRAATP